MAHPGTMHKYNKKLVAFEHVPPSCSTDSNAINTIIWIGGLGDGLLTVQYPHTISQSLPPNWRIAEILLRSSYNGWATGRLSRDAREISECVAYLKELRPGGKIVLMGHSTGCQDVMEYLVAPAAQTERLDKGLGVDGVILQGGVSDREAWADMLKSEEEKEQFEGIVKRAKELLDEGKGKSILQMEGNLVAEGLGAPMSAYRTYSLLAPGGDDDYFSTDVSDQHFKATFGKIPEGTKVAFLLGSEDPYVPKNVVKEELLEKWLKIIREGGAKVDDKNGGVVQGAHHNLNGDPDEVVGDLVKRVVGFAKGLEDEEGNGATGARL